MTRGTWKLLGLMATAASAAGVGFACQPAEDTTPSYEGSCPILVECAGTFAPGEQLFDDFNAIYGEDGSCWELGALHHIRCRSSCVSALDTYNLAVAATGVSCGLCSEDVDCTEEFGSDATCVSGYCARGQLGEIDTTGGVETGDEDGGGGVGPLPGLPPLDDACDVTVPRVVIETNLGALTVELDRATEPGAVELFLGHVSGDYYDNMLFHRVVDGVALHSGLFYDGLGLASPIGATYVGEPALPATGDELALTRFEGRISGAFYLADGASDENGVVIGTIVEGLEVRDAIAASEVRDIEWEGFTLVDVPVEDVLISRLSCE